MPATGPNLSTLEDRYAVERELGRGGFAIVYLAEERKHHRKVAIKVLHPEFSASVGAERFLREIGLAARLAHPHIVPLIDSGTADGLLYFVSPFVPGGSLRDRLARDVPIPLPEALSILREVGSGLDFVHRAGFIHRDVKPENILFADGHALLADFGLARATCADDDPSLPVTDAGIAIGTPEYMSPEQASGDSVLEPTTDVYSLAIVAYEMLAGEPPFSGRSARAIMARHVTEAPRPLRSRNANVSASTATAIERALSKAPEDRFATVSEFIAALSGGIERADRLPIAARSVAVLPFVNANGDAENEYLSDGLTDELIDALSKIATLRVASRTSVFALKGKLLDVRAIGALLGASYVLEGTVRRSASQLRVTARLSSTDDGSVVWSQRYDRSPKDVFTIQDELAHTIVDTLRLTPFAGGSTSVPKRYTANVTAYGLYLRGRYAWNRRSDKGVAEAIEYFEQAIREDPRYALAYTGLADAYSLHVDYRSVPVHDGFKRAKESARRAIELDDSLAEAHASLAWSLFIYDWDWRGADAEFLRAIECDPTYGPSHQWYAFLLAARGQVSEAIVEGHTALDLEPSSVSVRRGLGWLYFYARRWQQVRYHLERAISMDPGAEESYRALGLSLAVEGRLDDAVRVLREAVTMPGASSYTTATLGYALARAGEQAEAESLLRALEEESKRGYVSPAALATLQLGLGNIDAALDWIEAAYEARRGWLAYAKVNPVFDPLRGHPRFEAVVTKLKLT